MQHSWLENFCFFLITVVLFLATTMLLALIGGYFYCNMVDPSVCFMHETSCSVVEKNAVTNPEFPN